MKNNKGDGSVTSLTMYLPCIDVLETGREKRGGVNWCKEVDAIIREVIEVNVVPRIPWIKQGNTLRTTTSNGDEIITEHSNRGNVSKGLHFNRIDKSNSTCNTRW